MKKDLSRMKYKWRDSLTNDKYFGAKEVMDENQDLFEKFNKILTSAPKGLIFEMGRELEDDGVLERRLAGACGEKGKVTQYEFNEKFEDYNLAPPKVMLGLDTSRKKEIVDILRDTARNEISVMINMLKIRYKKFENTLNRSINMDFLKTMDIGRNELLKILQGIFNQVHKADICILEGCIHVIRVKVAMAESVMKKGLEFKNDDSNPIVDGDFSVADDEKIKPNDKEKRMTVKSESYLDVLEETVYEETLASFYEL